jgi:hypothetical protein
MKWILALLVIAVYLLHQDYWNWTDKSLVFGFMPKGLAYHAGYSFLAAVMMWILVKAAWPEQLERSVPEESLNVSAAEDAH